MNNVLKKQNEEDTIKSLNKLKNLSKEKDASLLFTSRQARLIQCEIERLNNIINELEKYLKEESKYDEYKDVFYREHMGYVLDKLKELKEGR